MRKPSTYLLFAFATTLLAGCATYRPRPIAPVQSAAAFDARSLSDPRLQAFLSAAAPDNQAAPQAWTLDTLTLAALYYHPDLSVAGAKAEASNAAVRTARQRPNPSLNFSPQYDVTTMIPSPWTIGAAINLLIETVGKRGDRTEAAIAQAAAARLDILSTAWQVRAGVRSALLDLWAAENHAYYAQTRLDQEGQLVGMLQRRLTVGEASGLDLSRESINWNQYQITFQAAQQAAATARAQLAVAIGVPARALAGVEIRLDNFQHDPKEYLADLARLREAALTDRADIRSSLSQYAASEAKLKLEVANQYPNIVLGPGYTFDQGDHKYSIPLTLDLPIFNQNQGPIAEATAHRKEAAASFLALQTQVIGAIDKSATIVEGATNGLDVADHALASSRAQRARIEHIFKLGGIDRPTLLASNLEVAAAELARFDALVAQQQAVGQLEDAVQQPLLGSRPLSISRGSDLRTAENLK